MKEYSDAEKKRYSKKKKMLGKIDHKLRKALDERLSITNLAAGYKPHKDEYKHIKS